MLWNTVWCHQQLAFSLVILCLPPHPIHLPESLESWILSYDVIWHRDPPFLPPACLPFADFPSSSFHCAHWKLFSIVKGKKQKTKNPWNLKKWKNNKKTLLNTFCLHTVCCLYLQAFDESWFCPRNISFLLFLSSKRRRSPVYCKTIRKWCQHYLSSKRPLPPPLKLAQFSFITFNMFCHSCLPVFRSLPHSWQPA